MSYIFLFLHTLLNFELDPVHYECYAVQTGFCFTPLKIVIVFACLFALAGI